MTQKTIGAERIGDGIFGAQDIDSTIG